MLAKGNVRVTVDDASMLEDTATKAYGWECNTESLRAAAAGNSELTQITDLLQLWMEKTRFGQDVRYLTISDLQSPEAQGLRKQIEKFSGTLTEQAEQLLHDARNILDSDNLTHRIAWIELWQNGTLVLSSVPERIGMLLKKDLFDQAATTLLIPQGSANHLPEILPPGGGAKTKLISHNEKIDLPLTIDTELPLETILSTPPEGKTILLVPSRSLAESLYVQNLEKFEAMGGTLICQGVSGGQGRMQAEFLAAKSPVIWIQTPFSFEGIDLPAGSIDRLILKALPFDHPSHTILSRRAQNYGNAFEDYLLPRLQHRLFRILRAFCRMRAEGAGVTVLDDRLEKKEYGQRLTRYLLLISGNSDLPADTAVPRTAKPKSAPKVTKETSAKKPRKKKASDTQLPLL